MKKKKNNINKDPDRAHPVKNWLKVICVILSFSIPWIVVLILSEFVFPENDSAFIVIAILGCFIIGIGLCNLVAILFGEVNFGYKATIWMLAIGSVITAATFIVMYVPEIYALFNEKIVSLYLFSYFLWFLLCFNYAFFRFGVTSFCKNKGMSKSRIKKLKKGMRNYWWYESIHKEYNLGIVYTPNKVFTVSVPTAFILHVLFGWIRPFIVLTCTTYVFTSLIMVILQIFSSIQNKREEYGVPFILFRKTTSKRIDSTIWDILWLILQLGADYAYIKMALEIFH